MKVTNNFDPRQMADVYVKRLKIQGEDKKHDIPKSSSQADSVEISSRARELQLYRTYLKMLPEIRDEMVESIKKRLAEGTYRIDREVIAGGIMEDSRLDKRV